ncbi:MAG: response regulator transcription factor [Clostridiales bacterium]|nr:response regulator transcription factor [Clostridiales bacterium]
MLNVAIVEDEEKAAQDLADALNKYCDEKGESIKTKVFPYAEAFLENYKPQYDIVFMDINLKGMDGMKAAHMLREKDGGVALIFITSMAQFAIEGYSVNAVDYIVKPFEYYDLKLRMDRVCRGLSKKTEEYINLFVKGGFKKVGVQDIYFVESRGHQLNYNTAEGEFSSYTKTMKELVSELSACGFLRCSVSTLVNVNHIKEIVGNQVTVGKSAVFMTRGYKKEFLSGLKAINPSFNEKGVWST